jgi:hypothetical protein
MKLNVITIKNNIMKTKVQPLKINQIAILENGDKVKCIKSNQIVYSCKNCYFYDLHDYNLTGLFTCTPSNRPDFQNVYFKKV